VAATVLQFPRVKVLWGSDDMGHRSGTLLAPDDLRKYVLAGHKAVAKLAHDAGRPYLLHSCGNLEAIMEDLIEDVRIDAKHSFEDVIMPVTEFKRLYGNRITPLGGLDVDVICRSSEDELRAYTRRLVEECFSDGWWALGTGNSLTSYMPVENYLIVLDEGLKVTGGKG